MRTHRDARRFGWTVCFCAATVMTVSPVAAAPPKSAKPPAKPAEKRSSQPDEAAAQLKQRLAEVEAELAKTRSQLTKATTSTAPRYQMLKAGERVVILDTQTGQTQIIDPEQPAPLQQVDVGKAFVVVTVLGNASPRSRTVSRTEIGTSDEPQAPQGD